MPRYKRKASRRYKRSRYGRSSGRVRYGHQVTYDIGTRYTGKRTQTAFTKYGKGMARKRLGGRHERMIVQPGIRLPTKGFIHTRQCLNASANPTAGGGLFNETIMVINGNDSLEPYDGNGTPGLLTSTETSPVRTVWYNFYDRELINRSALKTFITNRGGTQRVIVVIALRTNTHLAQTLKFSAVCDYPRLVYKILAPQSSIYVGGNCAKWFKYRGSTKSMFKKKTLTSNYDDFSQALTTHPTKGWYYHVILFESGDALLNAGTIQVESEIHFWSLFDNRDQL